MPTKTQFRRLMFAGVLLRVLCVTGLAGAPVQSESSSADLSWQIALLAVVFATDLMAFTGLVREELREWHSTRSALGKPVGQDKSALPSR